MSVALNRYTSMLLRRYLGLSVLLSAIPLPRSYYLGNSGALSFSLIAPFVLTISSGLVVAVWWVLQLLLLMVGGLSRIVLRKCVYLFCWIQKSNNRFPSGLRRDKANITKNSLISISLLFLIIFLLIPWQIVFLGCWTLQLYTCATRRPESPSGDSSPSHGRLSRNGLDRRDITAYHRVNNANLNEHILLSMTWLLPLVAPILAVWVRTLATAGFTTPFTGDHNFIMVAPFLVLVDFASWTQDGLFTKAR